jgi:hypothetical protein
MCLGHAITGFPPTAGRVQNRPLKRTVAPARNTSTLAATLFSFGLIK